jgi:hypothetical protein
MRSPLPALMLKDALVLGHEKRTIITWAILLLMSPLFTAAGNPFFALLFCVLPILTWGNLMFGYDEKHGGDRFLASLPVTRTQIVIARYCGAVAAALVTLGLMCALNPLAALAQRGLEGPVVSAFARIGVSQTTATRFVPPVTGFFVALYLGFFAVYVGLLYPLCYKMGLVKSRNVTIILMFLPGIAGGMLIGMDRIDPGTRGAVASLSAFFDASVPVAAMAAIVAGCAAVLAGSALLSIRFLRARDL